MRNKSFILILAFFFCITGCSDTVDRLKRIGRAPEMAKLDIPASETDYYDQEQMAASYAERKKKTNSLWQPGSTSFFRDTRAWKVGDIVKIVVKVSDSAKLDNTSKQSRTGANNLSAPAVFGKQKAIATFLSKAGDPTSLLSTKSTDNHIGSGNISRKEDIQTTIAAVVTQVLTNGNLVILGRQEIRVNHELREIKVSGIIRPRDINAYNSVSSDQIAEARISYGGRGIVSDIQNPKYGSQILDIISPF